MNYPFERILSFNKLYTILSTPICEKYHLTQLEFNILMFLENNPSFDTAADVVKVRRLSKSNVSMAIRALSEKGLLFSFPSKKDRRVMHLKVSDAAEAIISEGLTMQSAFFSGLFTDFTEEEQLAFQNYLSRISDNVTQYLSSL